MAAIETVGLTKRYGPVVAVDTLSFSVREAAVTGFLGPNGAGKTAGVVGALIWAVHPVAAARPDRREAPRHRLTDF